MILAVLESPRKTGSQAAAGVVEKTPQQRPGTRQTSECVGVCVCVHMYACIYIHNVCVCVCVCG